jgi:hypothetical protein
MEKIIHVRNGDTTEPELVDSYPVLAGDSAKDFTNDMELDAMNERKDEDNIPF